MVDNDVGDLRGRWKIDWLLYHDRDKDRCRHNHFYLTWLDRSDRCTRLGLNFWLFRLFFAVNNVPIFIDLYDFQCAVETAFVAVAAKANIALRGYISVIELAGAVKHSVHPIFSPILPDSACDQVLLIRYQKNVIALSFLFWEATEDLGAEIEISSAAMQVPAESCR